MSDIPEIPPAPETPLTPPPATESGLPPNIAAGLAEFFSIVGGLVFYFIEKKHPFIRFHALQSTYLGALGMVVGLGMSVVGAILAAIPVIGWLIGIALLILSPVYIVAFLVVWLLAVFHAFNGREWEIPWLGKLARKHLAEGLFFFVKSPAL